RRSLQRRDATSSCRVHAAGRKQETFAWGVREARGGPGNASRGLGRDQPGLLQSSVGAVLVNCLQPTRSQLDAHKSLQFGHPDPLFAQIRAKGTRDVLRYVTPHTAFLFRQTAAVDNTATRGS